MEQWLAGLARLVPDLLCCGQVPGCHRVGRAGSSCGWLVYRGGEDGIGGKVYVRWGANHEDEPECVDRDLLLDVVADGFTVYCCGPKSYPVALAASYEWPGWVDLVTIRGLDPATAARVPKRGPVDVFAPPTVAWAYQGPAEPTLRALLGLVHPDHPEAPSTEHPAPPSLLIPRREQRPMSIRLPPPGKTAARAARLAASAGRTSRGRAGPG